jgi:hypothetical protein
LARLGPTPVPVTVRFAASPNISDRQWNYFALSRLSIEPSRKEKPMKMIYGLAAVSALAFTLLPQIARADRVCREQCNAGVCRQECIETEGRGDRRGDRLDQREERRDERREERRDERPSIELRVPGIEIR